MARRPRFIRSEIYFPIIIAIHLVLWAIDLAMHGRPFALVDGENGIARVLGEVMSSWVITVFGFNLLMATRARWVERLFGGLDKMYLIHRRAGVIAMVLLLAHFGTVPRHPEFTIGKPLGFAAMVLIFIGVAISAAPLFKRRLSYRKWLGLHRLMGPLYVIGVAHAYTVPTLISELPLVRTYVFGMSILGIAAWLYRVLFHLRVHPRLDYAVTGVDRVGGTMVALEMAPDSAAMDFRPGQFAFFGFPAHNPRESHPFTVASHPLQDRLRVAIKAAGDFTTTIQDRVKVGDKVSIEGPYGHFTPAKGATRQQIWIAGGVGITPFLSLARDLEDGDGQVSLYWTVPTRDEAHFDAELQDLADRTPGLTYRLWRSNDEGRLTVAAMSEAVEGVDLEVSICGPGALRDALTDQFGAIGISARSIRSEEFEFR